MSKVYEALQHAHAERHLIVGKGGASGVQKQVIGLAHGLPALHMEREMGRLHHNLAALLPDSKENVIQFIGSRKDEGTSTILREYGLFVAQKINRSVLLVDGDSVQKAQHRAFGVYPKTSLQHVMKEGGSVDEAISQIKSSRAFLCRLYEDAGVNPKSHCSVNQSEIWNRLRKAFDWILIDSPPIGASDETLALCSSVDGVILVVEAEKTRFQVAANLKDRVMKAGGTVLGLVFNKQRLYIPEWIYRRL